MIINFNCDISKEEVQQMIDGAMTGMTSGMTGVINLSTATADEIKAAFTQPDKWLTSINYSGETYLEHHRRAIRGGETYDIYFYVVGAEANNLKQRIYDRILYAGLDPATGEINEGLSDYVPDVIYDLDLMNSEQLKVICSRGRSGGAVLPNMYRFGAVWTYGDRRYMAFSRDAVITTNAVLIGSAYDNGNIYFDRVVIFSDGSVTHNVFSTNITLTPVQ